MNLLKRFSMVVMAMVVLVIITTGCQAQKNVGSTSMNPQDEVGYVIGVTMGTTYQEVAEGFEKVIEVKTLKDDNYTLRELVDGRVDAVISDRLLALNAMKNGGFDNLVLAGEVIYDETMAVAINEKDDALRQAINEVLAEMIEDGTYAAISKKYFERNILDGFDYTETYENEEPAGDDSLQRVLDKGEISFAMSGGYPPFNYYNEDDELTGFDVDIGKEVAKRLGVTYVPVTTDWNGILEGLRSERYDGILGSMAVTDDRDEVVDFTNPYYYSGAQLIVQKDSKIKSVDDLK